VALKRVKANFLGGGGADGANTLYRRSFAKKKNFPGRGQNDCMHLKRASEKNKVLWVQKGWGCGTGP